MTEQERIEKFKDFMCFSLPHDFDMDSLIKSNFFKAPASLKYHGKWDGGLFDHSYTVAFKLVWLTKQLNLKWENERSPYIVGMFHDLCKVDDYYFNIGDSTWGYNDDATLLPGHGEKSVIMLQRLMLLSPLTNEEILCIRWHMGAFDSKENWNNYGNAIEKYPNILYTHTADMIAARIMGN